MKHIRSAIAAGLLVFGTAAVASAQTAQAAPAAPHAHGQRGARGQFGPGRGQGVLLKGIKLSDAEKANLKNVRAKYASQMKALREQYKPAKGQKIAKGDTAAMRQRWEQNKPLRDAQQQLMQAQRADIRAALSPENQAKFDANVQQVRNRLAKRAEKGKAFGRKGR
jgi:Spy/CpxP family protein refolding chaperone